MPERTLEQFARRIPVAGAAAFLFACASTPSATTPPSEAQAIRETEITFFSDGYELHGTWSEVDGSTTAAVLLHGSGLTDRNETFPAEMSFDGREVRFFEQISRALTEAGVSTLRFDKRGVREMSSAPPSAEAWKKASYEQLVNDARQAMATARANQGIKRVMLVGHSEGTAIALRLASEASAESPSSLILIGAMATNLKDAVRYQMVDGQVDGIWKLLDSNHDDVLAPDEVPNEMKASLPFEALDANADGRLSRAELRVPLEAQFAGFEQAIAADRTNELILNKPATWWQQHFAAPPPVTFASHIRASVLLMHGVEDPNVPYEKNALPLMNALKANKVDVTLKSYAKYGHGLAPLKNGAGTLGPMQSDALADLASWVREQVAEN